MRDTDLTGQTREGGQKLRSVPESDESTGVIKHIYMVAARSVETRSEQGAQGAVPKGATEMNCWAVRTGRTEQYVAWKDDLDHVMKINGQEDIETFLAALRVSTRKESLERHMHFSRRRMSRTRRCARRSG